MNKDLRRRLNIKLLIIISILLIIVFVNNIFAEIKIQKISISKNIVPIHSYQKTKMVDGYISNAQNIPLNDNNTIKKFKIVKQELAPFILDDTIANIQSKSPYSSDKDSIRWLFLLISVLILLIYAIKNHSLRKKVEKDMAITQKDLQESYMELEATHEELLASEEELNSQFIELQQKEEALRISRERYRLASKGAEVGMWDWDFNLKGIYLSTKAKEIVGLEEEEGLVYSNKILQKISELDRELLVRQYKSYYNGNQDIFEVKCRIEVRAQKFSWIYIRGKILFNEQGKPIRIAGSINNINKEKLAEAKIEKLAYYDELTNLPNKAFYNKKIKEYSKYKTNEFAILFIDLDNFKSINDCLGHEYGDSVLQKIAQIIEANIKDGDDLIRFGGDEFIIIVQDFNTKEDVKEYAEKIIKQFRKTIEIGGFGFLITLSIGISVYPYDDEKIEYLLKHADMALNEAKHKGKNCCEIYSKELNDKVTSKLKLESDLRQAVYNNEFKLYYQPKYNLITDEIIGYEALIRWDHPEKGLVSPKEFIPLAEEVGLIMPIGEWVIKEAVKQLGNWHDRGYESISMSINLSAKQFKDINLINLFKEVVKESNVQAKYVELEITETTALFDMSYATKILEELRILGFKIALDDFGTGYSSLNYLNSLPIDILKIDKSFIDNIIVKKEGEQIIKSVISLAHAYNMEVIAEGVETEEQLGFLREENCDAIQGYFVSCPKTNYEAISLIDERKKCG